MTSVRTSSVLASAHDIKTFQVLKGTPTATATHALLTKNVEAPATPPAPATPVTPVSSTPRLIKRNTINKQADAALRRHDLAIVCYDYDVQVSNPCEDMHRKLMHDQLRGHVSCVHVHTATRMSTSMLPCAMHTNAPHADQCGDI